MRGEKVFLKRETRRERYDALSTASDGSCDEHRVRRKQRTPKPFVIERKYVGPNIPRRTGEWTTFRSYDTAAKRDMALKKFTREIDRFVRLKLYEYRAARRT
jgi:hypothetical protein